MAVMGLKGDAEMEPRERRSQGPPATDGVGGKAGLDRSMANRRPHFIWAVTGSHEL